MSRTRTRLVLATGVVAVGAMCAIAPAAHASGASGGTQVTFQIPSGGSLSISVPASANLGSLSQSGPTGNYTGSGSLGTTTVTDTRGGILANSTVVATATTFAGTLSGNSGLPASDASLSSGLVSFGGGMVAVTGTPLTGSNLGGSGQQVMLGVTSGTGTATYNPTLSLTVPASSAIADTYTGTVTQTVS